jgi:CheY-like chemotaxis protein
VLLNLLSNAVKYNFAGGSITVGVDQQPDVNGFAVISVRDTGRGMTRDQLDRLYEPFDRLGIDQTSIEGTGIGLAISRRLVELMGGSIDVSSEPGVGSEFRVHLPLAAAVESPMTRTQITSTMPPPINLFEDTRRVGTILYIEDNPLNRLLIEQYLHLRPGLTLIQAEDGMSGVVLARSLQPDLTIVDINLPDIDGFEVLQRLRDDPVTRPLRCVALSANAMPQDIGRALQAGFAEYWTKPIAIDDFLSKVDACMARV